jgi:hypothetical protein
MSFVDEGLLKLNNMNDKFSKWNKRITAYLLLITGFYMGLMQYPIEYVAIFLGSGLAAIGMAIWQGVQRAKFGDLPPQKFEEK